MQVHIRSRASAKHPLHATLFESSRRQCKYRRLVWDWASLGHKLWHGFSMGAPLPLFLSLSLSLCVSMRACMCERVSVCVSVHDCVRCACKSQSSDLSSVCVRRWLWWVLENEVEGDWLLLTRLCGHVCVVLVFGLDTRVWCVVCALDAGPGLRRTELARTLGPMELYGSELLVQAAFQSYGFWAAGTQAPCTHICSRALPMHIRTHASPPPLCVVRCGCCAHVESLRNTSLSHVTHPTLAPLVLTRSQLAAPRCASNVLSSSCVALASS